MRKNCEDMLPPQLLNSISHLSTQHYFVVYREFGQRIGTLVTWSYTMSPDTIIKKRFNCICKLINNQIALNCRTNACHIISNKIFIFNFFFFVTWSLFFVLLLIYNYCNWFISIDSIKLIWCNCIDSNCWLITAVPKYLLLQHLLPWPAWVWGYPTKPGHTFLWIQSTYYLRLFP